LNNNGVSKPQQGMAQVDRSAYVNVTISIKGQRVQSASEWTEGKRLSINAEQVSVRLAPGGVAVVELKTN
jgi:hypothetical protein